MKPMQSTKATQGAFVELTGEAVTDAMIQAMLNYACMHGDLYTAAVCSRALRPLGTITTMAETAARDVARTECARQINERAESWLHAELDDRVLRVVADVPAVEPVPLRRGASNLAGPWSLEDTIDSADDDP